MNTLALLGGKPVRRQPFPPHPVIEKEEVNAVMKALNAGKLSGFIGAPGSQFEGGEFVRLFEKEFSRWNNSKYAISVNSATAGLHTALVALGVGYQDEVIVPPLTFSATSAAVLMCGAIPIFADVNEHDAIIDPKSIEKRISKKTKAIIVVHLFGKPAMMNKILAIARKHDLKVLEDAAQAPGASRNGKRTGNIGDIGVFSFTASKPMTTLGEGGMIVTKDKFYMRRCQLIRNHGEVMGNVESATMMKGILGWNYRLTEAAAAFGSAQLKKMDNFLTMRRNLSSYLQKKLQTLPLLSFPPIKENVVESHFIFPFFYEKKYLDIHRNTFLRALQAEGIPITPGYVEPLYLNPVYKQKQFNNNNHIPFSKEQVKKNIYKMGLCPVAENLYFNRLAVIPVVRPPAQFKDMDDIVMACKKICEHGDELAKWETRNKSD